MNSLIPYIVIGLTCFIGGVYLGYKYGSKELAIATKALDDLKQTAADIKKG
jgi:hypothetical protein